MHLRFRHVCLKVTDLERSLAFYRDMLGFTEGPAFTNDLGKKTGVFVYLDDGNFFELFTGAPGDFTGHLCFEVADIRKTAEALRAKGLDVREPSLGRSKAWLTSVKDPDGYVVELNEYSHPESWIARFLSENDPAHLPV